MKHGNSQLFFQPPPAFAVRMTPKSKPTSSKSSFRWPWSKKWKGDRTGRQQPDLEDPEQVDSEESSAKHLQPVPIDTTQVASPVVIASNIATTSSIEERRLGNTTSKETSPCQGGFEFGTTQATVSGAGASASLFTNASHFVVKRLQVQVDASQHGSDSNDPSGTLRPTIPISLST